MAAATRSESGSVTKCESSAKGSKEGSDVADAAAADGAGGDEDRTTVWPLDSDAAPTAVAAAADESRNSEVTFLYPDPTPAPSTSIKTLKRASSEEVRVAC